MQKGLKIRNSWIFKAQRVRYDTGLPVFRACTPRKVRKIIQVGYLKAVQRTKKKSSLRENRKFYRFELPLYIHGKMTIAEVNDQVVQVGSTPVLIENLSLGGIKVLSNLKLPVNSNMKFKFEFKVLNEVIEVLGN